MKKASRCLLAIFLALVMCLSGSTAAFAALEPLQPEESSGTGLTVEDIDPSSLNVKKLGEKQDLDIKGDAKLNKGNTVQYKPDDIVRVSIVLDKPGTSDAGYSVKGYTENKGAISYRNSLKRQQAEVERVINSKISTPLDVKWNLTLLVNVISANVKYKDINKIKLVSGVKDVVIENRYESETYKAAPHTANTSEYMVGAASAWSGGYTGAGTRIAIIDTGIDAAHIAFNEEAFKYSIAKAGDIDLMTENDIPSAELNGAGIFVSSKIPYAYNYIDGNTYNLGHIIDEQGNHGSHVAGIAAANRYIQDGSDFVDAAASTYAVGMAPDAQLIVMKVFGEGGGAYDSDYMAAIEDALVMQCDSVNLSLGSSVQGYTFAGLYQDVMDKLTAGLADSIVITSNGNSGALTDNLELGGLYAEDISQNTTGSPASFVNTLAVASADNTGTTSDAVMTFDGSAKVFYGDNATEKTSYPPIKTVTGSYSYVYIDSLGKPEDYATVAAAETLEGKILIVNRGEINFSAKGNNAIDYNPVAVIIANNQDGSIGMDLTGFTGGFPMVTIGLADATNIKALTEAKTAGEVTYYTGSVVIEDSIYSTHTDDPAKISNFSSWGVPGSLVMKPEITAPGGNIYSVNGTSISADDIGTGPDKYTNYSGTSMASPHVAGLAAVLSQSIDENDLLSKNADLAAKYSKRAVMQSLMMSTAEPLIGNGNNGPFYYPVLQQGAGLINVEKAANAKTVIMMDDEDNTLTAFTGAAADGKVKAELGDDLMANEDGSRQYSFTIYNTSDMDLGYDLDTDVFTQFIDYDGYDFYMSKGTTDIECDVKYDFEKEEPVAHDVNKDGLTNTEDAQAILDSLTGVVDAASLDAAAGDMDDDGKLSSHDAYLLLSYAATADYDLVVPAGGSKKVTVTLTPSAEDLEFLADYLKNGVYIEGFTYVSTEVEDADGALVNEEHSIPILGFIGNWTDPSMFDIDGLNDFYYNTYKYPYSYTQNIYTNYMTVSYKGVETEFTGNPYMVEEGGFPYDRLAINSKSAIGHIYYNLIRSAGTTGYGVIQHTADGDEVLKAVVKDNLVDGIWYQSTTNGINWYNMDTKSYAVGETPESYGLKEGDSFHAGFYAVPEYYGIMLEALIQIYSEQVPFINGSYSGALDSSYFNALLGMGLLGKGSNIGYDFVVDDTKPVIDKDSIALESEETTPEGSEEAVTTYSVSLKASDETNLAYVAVLSLDGENYYAEVAPGAKDYDGTLDITEAITAERGYVAIFAADYAGNETAVSLKINDDTEGIDPDSVAVIAIDPAELDIYKGNKAQIIPAIKPITALDQRVIWTSSDEAVATVDENGIVTGIDAGTAVITAAAHADVTKTAECTVKVTAVDKNFTAIVWDEEANEYFSSFNASSLPAWTSLHEEPYPGSLQLMTTLRTSGGMFAGTLDGNTGKTKLYTLDDAYAITELADNYVYALDLAPAPFSNDFFVYAYGPALIVGNLVPEDYGALYTGLPYAMLDASEATGDAYLAGVAAKKLGAEKSEYYFLDETGKIWSVELYMSLDEYYSVNFEFGQPTLVIDTGIATDFLYQDLYFDGTYIYWSHCDEVTADLMVIDPQTGIIYNAGDFGEGVWPVTGIYEDGVLAPDSELDTTSAKIDLSKMKVIDVKAQYDTKAIDARIEKAYNRYSKTSASTEPVNQANGGLNRLKNSVPVRLSADEPQADDSNIVTIEINYDEAKVFNGYYVVDYDSEKMIFNEAKSEFSEDIYSVRDDEVGKIHFAFADRGGIAAGEKIAVLAFDPKAEGSNSVTLETLELNGSLDLNEEEVIEITVEGEAYARCTGTALNLEGRVDILFYIKLPGDQTGWTAKTFFEDDGYAEPRNVVALDKSDKSVYNFSKNRYTVSCPNIEAKQMTEKAIVRVYDENGKQVKILRNGKYVDQVEYAAADWANYFLENPDERNTPLAKALLNYGQTAQEYFTYRVERPALPEGAVGEEMSTQMAAVVADSAYDWEKLPNAEDYKALKQSGIRLNLVGDTELMVMFKTSDAVVEIDGENVPLKPFNDKWYASIPNIASKDLGKKYQLDITYGDSSGTLSVCALSWANLILNTESSTDSNINMAKALYVYYNAAAKYFAQ